MFAKLVSLAALAALVNAEHWIFGGVKPIITTRLDSIVNPDAIGTHVHAVVGASRFKNVYDETDLQNSKCTTIPVQPDKSNYWTPQLYQRDQNSGHLTPIPTTFNIYYLVRTGSKNAPVKAFPPGLRMVAGDTNRRTYNASSFADQAVSFVCLDYSGAHSNDPDWAERNDFFDHNCPNGMRSQVFFPSCWDGKNLDSEDHKSHMSYPIDNYNGGNCPDSHPVQLVSLFYEMLSSVDQFPYWGKGTWVLANGDPTGDAFHGDFQNGWDVNLLQTAIDTCQNANGNVMDCPPLAAIFDQASADACTLETEYVNENIGLDPSAPITQLPGCNPIWDGTGSKPACTSANVAAPELVPAQSPLPSGWSEVGCIAEGTNGRALTGTSTKSATMTRAQCASFCASKGFKLAGVEFSDECYCDNEVRNGASQSPVKWNLCTDHCAGNSNEICGGPQRLTLLTIANAGAPVPPSSVSSAPVKPSSSANAASSVIVPPTTSTHSAIVAIPSVPSTSATRATSSSAAVGSSSAAAVISSASSPAAPSATGKVVLPGWSGVGCVSDSNARALTGFSFAKDQMTVASCTSACAAKGFSMAGVEFGRECYCGNSFSNSQGKALAASQCNIACAGDKASTCGGNWALAAYKTNTVNVDIPVPAPPSAPTSSASNSTNVSGLPAGWTAAGCVQDNVHGRALNKDAYTSTQMTIGGCIAHCAQLGHPVAGVEYARECYCGSAFVNGGGAPLADGACNMPCDGDKTRVCGGKDALTVFKNTGANASVNSNRKRGHKARSFGKAHRHSDVF